MNPERESDEGPIVAQGLARRRRWNTRFQRSIRLNQQLCLSGSGDVSIVVFPEKPRQAIRPVQSTVRTRPASAGPVCGIQARCSLPPMAVRDRTRSIGRIGTCGPRLFCSLSPSIGRRAGARRRSRRRRSNPRPGNPVAVISTSMGDITVELFKDRAPVSVENFLRYVERGFLPGHDLPPRGEEVRGPGRRLHARDGRESRRTSRSRTKRRTA